MVANEKCSRYESSCKNDNYDKIQSLDKTELRMRKQHIHATIHWPEMSDPGLWPIEVQHAVYVFNCMPHLDSGLCPLDCHHHYQHASSFIGDIDFTSSCDFVVEKGTFSLGCSLCSDCFGTGDSESCTGPSLFSSSWLE
jgi:hypothetical protein